MYTERDSEVISKFLGDIQEKKAENMHRVLVSQGTILAGTLLAQNYLNNQAAQQQAAQAQLEQELAAEGWIGPYTAKGITSKRAKQNIENLTTGDFWSKTRTRVRVTLPDNFSRNLNECDGLGEVLDGEFAGNRLEIKFIFRSDWFAFKMVGETGHFNAQQASEEQAPPDEVAPPAISQSPKVSEAEKAEKAEKAITQAVANEVWLKHGLKVTLTFPSRPAYGDEQGEALATSRRARSLARHSRSGSYSLAGASGGRATTWTRRHEAPQRERRLDRRDSRTGAHSPHQALTLT